jgi:hypothetical protein
VKPGLQTYGSTELLNAAPRTPLPLTTPFGLSTE